MVNQIKSLNQFDAWCCWWKKSCTSWWVVYHIIYKALYTSRSSLFISILQHALSTWQIKKKTLPPKLGWSLMSQKRITKLTIVELSKKNPLKVLGELSSVSTTLHCTSTLHWKIPKNMQVLDRFFNPTSSRLGTWSLTLEKLQKKFNSICCYFQNKHQPIHLWWLPSPKIHHGVIGTIPFNWKERNFWHPKTGFKTTLKSRSPCLFFLLAFESWVDCEWFPWSIFSGSTMG